MKIEIHLSASAPDPFDGKVASLTSWMVLLGFPCQCYCDAAARYHWPFCHLEARILFPSATVTELPAISGRRTPEQSACLGLEGLVTFLSNSISDIPVTSLPDHSMKAMWPIPLHS